MQVYFSGTQAAGESVTANALLMMLVGLFINAPYALITTAVSAAKVASNHSVITAQTRSRTAGLSPGPL